MLHTLRDDLYIVVGVVSPVTKMASLQVHINPLVPWVWIGCLVLIAGSFVCMWPELVLEESRAWRVARGTAAITASIGMGIVIALLPAPAFGQTNTQPVPQSNAATGPGADMTGMGGDDMHGVVRIDNETERALFSKLRCQCGCPTDLLSTCSCSAFAEPARNRIRAQLAAGKSPDDIVAEYAATYGTNSISVPSNRGNLRLIYAVPLAIFVGSAIGVGFLIKRWKGGGAAPGTLTPHAVASASAPQTAAAIKSNDDYDARLDAELEDLDG